jgi:potassium efflux system protein
VFKGFGGSALDFELRLFIPDLENYVTIWHEINRNIDQAFRKAKIEIAFPQRDVHVRSVKAPFPIQSLHENQQKGPSGDEK